MKVLKYKDKDGKEQILNPIVVNSGSELPEDGEVGQVLTKTDDGVEWADSKGGEIDTSNLVTKEEFNKIFNWYEL